MLTADLVKARRKDGELVVVALDARARARATALAARYLEAAEQNLGRRRDELDEAFAAVEVEPRDRKLADGVRKLVEDRCAFEAAPALPPDELRREVFLAASAARRAGTFDRAALIAEHAARHGLDADALERALYADLRGAQLLQGFDKAAPADLIAGYDLAQAQAVLLRAVSVTVDVSCASPAAYRALFHKLKFLRLLHRIEPADDGYRIEIDGPFSLFESVTRYGLQLALALPALAECDRFRLTADVRWAKERAPLRYRLEGGRSGPRSRPTRELPEEVAALLDGLRAIETPWRASPAAQIFDLPGVGCCVPDLVFEHAATGECIYLEVLGYWSREAVWRRVELVERGLGQRILFAVGAQLRVSEQALDGDLPGALYVYKRSINPRAILERVDQLAARTVRA